MNSPGLKDGKDDLKVKVSPPHNPHRKNNRNDIKPLRTTKMLEKIDLDLDSPRLQIAMDNLGISAKELKLR